MAARVRPSPALVIALVALFVSIGGVGYAASKIGTNDIQNGAVTNKKLHKAAVKTRKLAKKAVKSGKLADQAVGTGKIADGAVTSAKVAKLAPIQAAGLVTAVDCSSAGPNQWISKNPDAFGNVGYYRDLDGQVHLAGTTQKCGSPPGGAVVFALPRGYRPQNTQEQTTPVIGGTAPTTNVIAFDDGEIAVNVNSKDAVSLAGISFRCAPPGTSGCPEVGN